MKKLNIFKKGISFTLSSALSVSLLAAYPYAADKNPNKASAMTIAEMQEEINNNKEQINELQSQIDALEGNKAEQEQYQALLSDQIEKIYNNIALLAQEIESISEDIEATNLKISDLNDAITGQQEEIDNNIELFKQRLCNMYISGNENLASVMVGTSSFYDMISRVEMVNRIASYDEQLINDILADIEKMDQNKKERESERLTLQMKKEEQEKRQEEKKKECDALNEQKRKTQAEIDRLAAEEAMYQQKKAELDAANADFDSQIAELERQYREEQERRAREAAAAAASAQSSGYSYSGPSYVPVSASASGFAWPAPGFCYISSYYGPRWGSFHGGIDVGDAGIYGGNAVASKAGTVIYVYNSCNEDYPKDGYCPCGACGNYGNYVIISHDGTYSTVYAHLSRAYVSTGQYVEQGQVIGAIGTTGWSTGAHLHFEVRVNGSRDNPLNYVSP